MKFLDLNQGPVQQWVCGIERRVAFLDSGAKQIALMYQDYRPGCELPRHRHARTEQVMICLEGEGELLLADRAEPFGPWDAVWAPAGQVHGFTNPSEKHCRALVFQTPPLDTAEESWEVTEPATDAAARATVVRDIRTVRENPNRPGKWREIFTAQNKGMRLMLDHITLTAGQAVSMPAGRRESIMVVVEGVATVRSNGLWPMAAKSVLLIQPVDSDVPVVAGREGAVLLRAGLAEPMSSGLSRRSFRMPL